MVSVCERSIEQGKVKFVFGTTAEVQDAYTGTVVLKDGSGVLTRSFDLVVACDGAGSTARTKIMADVPGFKSEKASLTNFCTMLHFDQNTAELDPSWLYVLNIDPPAVAGAINGDGGPKDPKWSRAKLSCLGVMFGPPDVSTLS